MGPRPLAAMRLELTRCTVRPWLPTDVTALARHANNRNVSIHLRDRFPFPYELEHARKFLDWLAVQDKPTVWAIEVDGEAAGGIGIEQKADVERISAEIGYWLGESCWNRGIVTEALQAVSAEMFRRYDLTRLYALPFADNTASVRVLKKAGYVVEGRLHRSAIKDGKVRDQLLYAKYRP